MRISGEEIDRAISELGLVVMMKTDGQVTHGVGDAGRCTDTAQWLRRRLGGKVMGYQHDNNPKAKIGEDTFGHDFLLTADGRYIVDWWAREYLGLPYAYDLEDKSQAAEALENYGPRRLWKPVPDWPADWYERG